MLQTQNDPQIKAARAAGNCSRGVPGSLSGDVAIKEIVPPPNLTTEARQELRVRSLREARAIAQLDHVNVVRVFDVLLSADGDPQIVMEYVPSRSLHDAITTDGPIPPVRAAAIGLAVLGALRAAHRPGSCIATSNRPTSSSARTAGAAIQLTTCNTTPAQQFTLDGDQPGQRAQRDVPGRGRPEHRERGADRAAELWHRHEPPAVDPEMTA